MNQEKVYFNEDYKVCIACFEGFLTLEEFKSITLEVNVLRKSKSSDIQLAIVKDMKVMSVEIQAWIKSDLVPMSIKDGLKYLGFVVPKSAIAHMSMKSVSKEVEEKSSLNIQYFSSEKEAFSWVESTQN